MAKTKEPDYKVLCTKYKFDLDARFDGETGFIYFEGGRCFWRIDGGSFDVRESWGSPDEKTSRRIFQVLAAWEQFLKAKRDDAATAAGLVAVSEIAPVPLTASEETS